MYLENNNIKVLRIFFKFSIEKLRKIFKTFRKILENSEIFLKNIGNVLENLVNFYKI